MLSPREKNNLEKHLSKVDVSKLSAAFDALSEPNRCLIFRALLKGKGASVNDIAVVIGISASLASQHLKVLQQAGLLIREKQGKNVYYEINSKEPLVAALQKAVEDNG